MTGLMIASLFFWFWALLLAGASGIAHSEGDRSLTTAGLVLTLTCAAVAFALQVMG